MQDANATPWTTNKVVALIAICGGRGALLGQADSYDVVANKATDALLVDLRLGGSRRLLLVSQAADGGPMVEDVSGQIAVAAGKEPMATLEGVEVGLASFASSGAVAVAPRKGAELSQSIDLAAQVRSERAVRAGSQVKP